MSSPFRSNRLKTVVKYRHITSFMSVFFLIIILSSYKPAFNTLKFDNLPKTKDTIYIYDTVYQYDTVFAFDTAYIYDTLYLINPKEILINEDSSVNPRNNHILIDKFAPYNPLQKYFFSLEFFASPTYSLHTLKSDFIYNNYALINKSSLSPDIGNSYGIGINYHHGLGYFSSGIIYSKIRENFDFLATEYILEEKQKYDFFTTTVTYIDTIEFINIDTLLATGDTVYEYYYDVTETSELDSNLVNYTDTTESKYIDKSKNRFMYVEIPLKYGFTFYKPGFSISPEFGLITSFFVNSKGKIVSLANLSQSNSIKEEVEFAAVNLSFYTGLKLNFSLSGKFDLFSAAYYKQNINSIFKNYPVVSRYNTIGFSFGLRYKILFNTSHP